MSKRVLHVIPSVAACRGGPSKAVVEMVIALNNIGVDTEIITTNDACNTVLDVELNSLINFQGAPCRFFQRYSSTIPSIREFQYSNGLRQWLKHNIQRYDLVHVHAIFSYCSSYAMWLARKKNIPYIVRPIGQLEDWALKQKALKKTVFLNLIERNNLISANQVHFTAQSEQQQAHQQLPLQSSVVIPLGIELPTLIDNATSKLRQQYNIADGNTIICCVSRIHQKKGLELLLNSLAKLNTRSFDLLIAGDGDPGYLNKLKELVAELGLEPNVQWLGFLTGDAKNRLLQGSGLFALTSYSENFGISVLESLAAGTPALVSRGVALSEQIEQHDLGYVVDLNQQDITATLQDALKQLHTKTGFTQVTRDFVDQQFNWSTIAARLNEVYKTL